MTQLDTAESPTESINTLKEVTEMARFMIPRVAHCGAGARPQS